MRNLRRPRTQKQELRERVEGITVDLPDGRGGSRHAIAEARGTRRQKLTFRFPERAYLRFNADRNEMKVQANATALWADGLPTWMRDWLDPVGWLLTGRHCAPETAWTVGWRTHGLEMCSDFVGFPLRREDGGRFTGKAGGQVFDKLSPDGLVVVSGGFGNLVNGIAIGKRASPFSLVIYSKTAELRARGASPGDSIYAPTWRLSPAFGGDQEVVRVELRFGPRGLRHEVLGPRGHSTGQVLDLSRPEALLDQSILKTVWATQTTRVRLVVAPEQSARKRRLPTDPRWVAVQDAGGIDVLRMRQARAVRQLTHDKRKQRAVRSTVRGAMAYAALHDCATTDTDDLKRAAALAIEDARALDPKFNRDAYASRLGANHEFVADQCKEGRLEFSRRMRTIAAQTPGWEALTPLAKLRRVARAWQARSAA